ncbi:PilW family protein [Thauera humireducens]|uniref:Pilus assembly protein PilW n=1 Tax=Thauera humireducens TaxID=1134435 RepID=A0A140IEI6_9RHOO|nr:PilW family protein [Thauera humireducens]AMO36161.1 hypothetical protein AC731_003925 [Thauera humireducens]
MSGRSSAGLKRASGFTLVEIMVGMVVALLALLVIMQVFGSFEGQKRMTTGTADAQTNGALALQSVLRETQLAGFGISAFDRRVGPLECSTAQNASLALGVFSMAPVEVTDGGAAGSDTLTIRYGSSMSGGVATRITSVSGNQLSVDSNLGCRVGDTAVVSNGGDTCFVVSVDSLDAGTPPAVPPKINLENPVTPGVSLGSLPTVNAFVSCMGQYREVTFAVNGDRLERDGEEVASGIVNMQVQYGITATPADIQIAQWVDSNADWANLSDQGATDIDRRKRIKALRVAIVARNPTRDADVVSQACVQPADLADPAIGVCAWKNEAGSPAPAINLSDPADPNEWRHYRYRVFETIIPLRNVVWAREAM